MSISPLIKRRKLLLLCATAPLLLIHLPSVSAVTPTQEPAAERDLTGLCGLLPDLDAARLIGDRLIEQAATPADPAALLHDTGLDPSWPGDRMLAALRERRALDFAAGRTVALDGWILARCEAALCQLLALGAPSC